MSSDAVVVVQGSSGGGTGGGSTGSGASSFGGWGDGWRSQMAVGSTDTEKELTQLGRYESPEQIWRKAKELERKMSSGEMRPVLPKDATAQEVAAWRQGSGIPAKPEDYKINMPAGKQTPKEDDAFLKTFLKSAHDSHYTQPQVDQAINAFYAEVDRQAEAFTAAEQKAVETCEDELRKVWGSDYRVNKNLEEALLTRAPAGFKDKFMNGYLADHTPIRASAEAHKWLVQMEREINPAGTVVPNIGGDVGKTIAKEMQDLLSASQAPKNTPAWKSYWEQGGDQRYRDLINVQEKIGAKKAA